LAELVSGAADAGTLLSVDLTGLSLRGEEASDAGRPSFLVEVRRATERLRREGGEQDAGLVQAARGAVSVALDRREPLEPVP
ncbi:MAG: hypothetical protein IH987_14855, partial [Planctomycetes bacterium]|nr:hypothetical protein [Planctomycetota bacterium]